QGGNLLIATDYPYQLADFRVHIAGEKIQQVATPAPYRDTPECPFLRYEAPTDNWRRQAHPLFQFLQQGIATNCPSHMVFSWEKPVYQPLLQFPWQAVQIPGDPPIMAL